MSPAKLNFTEGAPTSYDDVVTQWRKRNPAHVPFSRNFLVEFVTQLSRTAHIDVSTAQVERMIREGAVCNYTGTVHDLVAVFNHREVARYLNALYKMDTPVDEDMLRQVHARLMNNVFNEKLLYVDKEQPGEYRKRNYDKGVCTGISYEQIPSWVQDVCRMDPARYDDALEYAADLHCCLYYIRPFAAGNCYTIKWLTNYVLVNHGHPPIIFSEDSKAEYAELIADFNTTQDHRPFREWLREQTVASYNAWAEDI